MKENVKLFLLILKACVYIAALIICIICALSRHDAYYASLATFFLILIKTEIKEPEEDESEKAD